MFGHLLVGTRAALRRHRVDVVEIAEAHEFLRACAEQPFDRILVDPAASLGMEMVKALKPPMLRMKWPAAVPARERHRKTPLFLTPIAGESEYAVIIEAPHWSFLEDGVRLPFEVAVAFLDVDALIASCPPQA